MFEITFNIDTDPKFDSKHIEKIDSYIENQDYKNEYRDLSNNIDLINKTEVKQAVKQLKPNSAPGLDGVYNLMIKHFPSKFWDQIINLFNICLEDKCIPSDWKTSKITVIPKKKLSTNPDYYRPISVTSCLGKVLERIITKRLYKYLEESNLITQEQSGFRRRRRTGDNLFFLTQKVSETLNRKKKHVVYFSIFPRLLTKSGITA